jgi:hypothetical protein
LCQALSALAGGFSFTFFKSDFDIGGAPVSLKILLGLMFVGFGVMRQLQ